MAQVGQAMLDLVSNAKVEPIVNIIHPKPVSWSDVILWVRGALASTLGAQQLPVIPARDWLQLLEDRSRAASSDDLRNIVSTAITSRRALLMYGFF